MKNWIIFDICGSGFETVPMGKNFNELTFVGRCVRLEADLT